ncbi:iron-siderophore ABC transporter substrate-binding protein [Modestobacter sp. VKM Ac-2979]|uniref:iron-siderophore ABC transporter substrate-binding protein n=1 Tax=unclassified Modestobacter TaxID=2643866 RepID=UPI0022AB941E|nr:MULTISPECIES: iron-siderophore ABC transporter substrate-binding protein [unclassified Modestobacter]MCZ2814223.1 iron-siderophore ABC transporter substrate-binding protein [Modestobacter sp. VKM Ac-2979]MCZ2844085.1 iron-siderophore ABC transporter substrate-binding protein [Modestobacter sp. VKM Ac-2980]
MLLSRSLARRTSTTAVVLPVLAVAVLAGCSSESDEQPAEAAAGSAAEAAFPVTIEHAYGTTTIPEEPERVVSLGYTEQDAILAFGVVPVAVRYAFGPEDDVFFPWADEAAGDADPEILSRAEVDPEQIASLDPDLIMAVTAGLTEDEYETLSAIAPTVVQPEEHIAFGTPWQEQTRITGEALGQPDRAEELIADVEEQIAAARAEHPELEGKTVTLSGPAYGGEYPFHTSDDTRTRFFLDLGMVVDPALDAAAQSDFYGTVSREEARMLDADVLVFQSGSEAERAGIEGDPVLSGLPTVTEGRSIFIEDEDYAALQFASALSLPYLLDGFAPELSEVVG